MIQLKAFSHDLRKKNGWNRIRTTWKTRSALASSQFKMTVLPVVTGFLYRLRTQTIIRQKVYCSKLNLNKGTNGFWYFPQQTTIPNDSACHKLWEVYPPILQLKPSEPQLRMIGRVGESVPLARADFLAQFWTKVQKPKCTPYQFAKSFHDFRNSQQVVWYWTGNRELLTKPTDNAAIETAKLKIHRCVPKSPSGSPSPGQALSYRSAITKARELPLERRRLIFTSMLQLPNSFSWYPFAEHAGFPLPLGDRMWIGLPWD